MDHNNCTVDSIKKPRKATGETSPTDAPNRATTALHTLHLHSSTDYGRLFVCNSNGSVSEHWQMASEHVQNQPQSANQEETTDFSFSSILGITKGG